LPALQIGVACSRGSARGCPLWPAGTCAARFMGRKMAQRLPPLNTLRLFEAAGRHLSFKLAAKELGLTPSAISHAVQGLEDSLGSPLFARTSRGLNLTEGGARYLASVRQALTILAGSVGSIKSGHTDHYLSISAAPTFATRILLPRLHRFRQAHPEIAINLDTSHRHVELLREGVDLAIRVGAGPWDGYEAIELMAETLVPVAAPGLLQRLGPNASFCDTALIQVKSVTQDWREWAEGAARPAPDCKRGFVVDTLQMAFDAAERGLGVTIGHLPLIEPELREGRLVEFCGPAVTSKTRYWMLTLPGAMRRPTIQTFRNWLLGELEVVNGTRPSQGPGQTSLRDCDPTADARFGLL
jgi:LysR family glycine cleavage system transcriptional activator